VLHAHPGPDHQRDPARDPVVLQQRFFGQTKSDDDRKEVLAHLARSTKGFVNSEYDRFLARMPIAMSIVKLGYTRT